ncbi:hypothetical protein GGR57DRAFT_464822 [Xylariaceae sp. FL1272]|nr:hypothetical protein GGR57DRAFT_464822 [Xylariaceae sp. FL1272]
MSNNPKLDDFPDVETKLQKPTKQSAFEKQKADAEAKRKREAAETAAVYESFVKSFDNDDDDDENTGIFARNSHQNSASVARPAPSFGGGGGHGRRHFGASNTGTGLKSGPGSLGPVPTAYGRKNQDVFQQRKGYDEGRGRLGFRDEDTISGPPSRTKGVSKAFDTSDDEGEARSRDVAEEKAFARPTVRLSNLPPRTSPGVVKALIPASLVVENVKILPSTSGGSERKSVAAIVTLSPETAAADIDSAVSSLQNRYLGYGFYLSLHRHLSSAVSSTAVSGPISSSMSHPFGAKPVPQANESNPYQQPGGFNRGFAPPTNYSVGGGPISKTILHVPVQAPGDIKQIKLIHKVVESVLEHGPEFEALLMSRPNVQRDEKWAWIWDARSEGGVWYRWRLWEVVTGGQANGNQPGKYLPLFEGSHAWKMPEKRLAFEYTTGVDEFISDPEYTSSDEEEFEEEGNKATENAEHDKKYLNPLDKAKLTHLLARLPTAIARIRKGDIARVTAFAILHSSRGADEIVEAIVANVVKPLAQTSANPDFTRNDPNDELHESGIGEDAVTKTTETQDTSGASLVGLYVISDIMSSSATSGVRHAWRYRQLFETSLKRSQAFETLGLLAERLNWGRLRIEKWKRSVGLILSLWEGWCAFPNETQQFFSETFENPPGAKKEEQAEDGPKKGGKWKTVEARAPAPNESGGFLPVSTTSGADSHGGEVGDATSDLDGEMMDEDTDMMDVELDSDIDGVPMDDDDGVPMDQDPKPGDGAEAGDVKADSNEMDPKPAQPPRKRMRAVDMFADSDSSDHGN